MCNDAETLSFECTPHPTTERCIAFGHGGGQFGRHKIGKDGFCQNGRRLNARAVICPLCFNKHLAKEGFVVDHEALKSNPFLQNLLQGITQVCSTCAAQYNEDSNVFISAKEVRGFVQSFLSGRHVTHRREERNGEMVNFCDICSKEMMRNQMEDSRGVIRDRAVICLCKQCFALGNPQGDNALEEVTFLQALARVVPGFKVPSAKKPTSKKRKAPTFESLLDLARAIKDGEWIEFSSGKDKSTGLTQCCGSANGVCEGIGRSHWEQMGVLTNTNRNGNLCGHPFCPECVAALQVRGIQTDYPNFRRFIIEEVYGGSVGPKQLWYRTSVRDMLPRKNPDCPLSSYPQVSMEYVDPNASPGNKNSRSGQRSKRYRRQRREEAKAAKQARLNELHERLDKLRERLNDLNSRIADWRECESELGDEAREEITRLETQKSSVTRQITQLKNNIQQVEKTSWKKFAPKKSKKDKRAGVSGSGIVNP